LPLLSAAFSSARLCATIAVIARSCIIWLAIAAAASGSAGYGLIDSAPVMPTEILPPEAQPVCRNSGRNAFYLRIQLDDRSHNGRATLLSVASV
jgi:hypothetical protein